MLRHQSSCCVLGDRYHGDKPGQRVLGPRFWWWIYPEIYCVVSIIKHTQDKRFSAISNWNYLHTLILPFKGSSKHPGGSMNGHLCLCQHPKTTCLWLGYSQALAISSASYLRINSAQDLLVKLYQYGQKVCSLVLPSFQPPSVILLSERDHLWTLIVLLAVPTEVPKTSTGVPALEPPTLLSANRTGRGVLLQWQPPEAPLSPLTGFVLQARRDQGQWIIIGSNIYANRSEVLVQGLLRVIVIY